ncbi:MAG TPA: hypothetical protein VGK87_03695, partial [Anaerolineae bacterium]
MAHHTKSKTCYYCGKPATSLEHVPPRMMFSGFDCGSITVPSCATHNTHKRGHDQAIVNMMLQGLNEGGGNVGDKYPPLGADVKKAI